MGYNKITYDAMTMLMIRRHHSSSGPKTFTGTVLFFSSAVLFLIVFKSDIINRAVGNKTLASVLKIFLTVTAVFMFMGAVKAG